MRARPVARAGARLHDRAATPADALHAVKLGHAHKSPERRHAHKHAQLQRWAQSHRGKPHVWNLCKKNPNKNNRAAE